MRMQEDSLHEQLHSLRKTDFADTQCSAIASMSKEDKYALNVMERCVTFENGHYVMPLMWRPGASELPCNRNMAFNRLASLKRRLQRDQDLRRSYVETVQNYIENDYAREVPVESIPCDVVWYLLHNAVKHPRKGKVRVVFDCSAKTKGLSLNDVLLQGPDLANSLVGVLLRFRMEPVASVSDIASMFHQIRVDQKEYDALRFLWWPNGDLNAEPTDHQMLVHLFGSTSSPSIANFCLRPVADDFGEAFDAETTETVRRNFYVDDLLRTVATEDAAVRLVSQLCSLLKRGGFQLTKWPSNNRNAIASIPVEERSTSASLDLNPDLTERVLGVRWNVNNDLFGFKICTTLPTKSYS